jgi:predicted small integral membrane protein
MELDVTLIIRLCQTVFVALIGLFAGLVTLNNLTDYGTNFRFVQHLMGMDTLFPDTTLTSRRITSPFLHKLFYAIIIVVEGLTSLLCLAGAAVLAVHLGATPEVFHAHKGFSFAGLALGFSLWFGGFLIIGGQWFASWQSERWNGRESAFMFYMPIAFVFLALLHKA